MSRINSSGCSKHHFTSYIKILENESNSIYNKKVQCIACRDNLGDNAHIFTNKKDRVKRHLKNCDFFKKKWGEERVYEILHKSDNSDNEISVKKQRIGKYIFKNKIYYFTFDF
jgi:hypothetical protein